MRTLTLIVGLLVGAQVFAAANSAESKKKPAAPIAGGSQTEHNFEDLLVQGKYHFSDESVTTVEEDKVLDALIGVRTDFKDRIENSAEQN